MIMFLYHIMGNEKITELVEYNYLVYIMILEIHLNQPNVRD